MTDTRKLLLKGADIVALEGERRVHFLNDNAVRVNKSPGDAAGLNHIDGHIIEVQPGHDATEYLLHWYEEECICCLAGRGEFEVGISLIWALLYIPIAVLMASFGPLLHLLHRLVVL